MLVIVAPGQGSQTPGFLTPWLELSGASEQLTGLGEQAGLDLLAHGTTSDADTIKDTAVAQPLIVAAGLLTWRALFGDAVPDGAVGAVSGHSVGEVTAAAAAGVMSEQDAMDLVALRGRAMAEASALRPTGMSAVLGGDPEQVLAALDSHGLTPANMNGGGQVVAAGTMEQLAALAAQPPAKARVIPLKVAGAFHTEHMRPAVAALAEKAENLTVSDPAITLVSNKDGGTVDTGAEALARLVNQVSNPVRWDLCMETFSRLGVTGLLELAPAGTLVGLAKRALRGVETVALKTPDDLDVARLLVRNHGSSEPTTPSQEG